MWSVSEPPHMCRLMLRDLLMVMGGFSEIRVLPVDEEAEWRQGRSQFGGLAAGGGQEGVVLELLEGLQRGTFYSSQALDALQQEASLSPVRTWSSLKAW